MVVRTTSPHLFISIIKYFLQSLEQTVHLFSCTDSNAEIFAYSRLVPESYEYLSLFEFSEKVTVISRKYENLKDAHFTADSLDLYDFEGIEHLQFMHDYYFGEFYQDSNRDQLIGYTEFALRNGMTVSNFHFSRDDMEKVWQWIDRSDAKLREGMPDRDTIYMFRNEDVDKDEVLEKYSGVTWIFTDKEMIAVPER